MPRIEEQSQKIQEILDSDENDAVKIDRIAKVRGWHRPTTDSIRYPIIQDFLAEKCSLEDATKKLCTPIDEKIAAERLDDVNFMDLWYSIMHSARRNSFRDTGKFNSLVDLVFAFKEHSIPNNEKYNYLYNALTDFGMASREAYNDQPTPGSTSDVEIISWANMNYFFALLTGKEVADNSIFAIWAMRQALETPHKDDEQSTAVQKYNTYVPAAAIWAIGGFSTLFNKNEDLTPKDKKQGNPGRGGELWKGKAEFSKKRWEFWLSRLAEIGKMEEVSDTTRIVARDAVEAMERAATFEKV